MAKNFWFIRAYPEHKPHLDIFKEQGVIGLGWNKLGDLTNSNLDDLKQLFIEKGYPAPTEQAMGTRVGFFKRFIKDMKIDDYVLVPDKPHQEVNIGIVTSDYSFHKVTPYLSHIRKVKWIKKGPLHIFSDEEQKMLSNRLTLISLEKISEKLNSVVHDDAEITIHSTSNKTFQAIINKKKINLSLDNDISSLELQSFFKEVLSSMTH